MSVKKIVLTENDIKGLVMEVIDELVYINNLTQNKKAQLNYDTSNGKHTDNVFGTDYVKTDKMDANNDDTYEVPLKGGLMSYNITSIVGTQVMHYFKKYFQHEKEMINIGGEDYELTMQEQQFKRFMDQFKSKIWRVISKKIEEYVRDENFKPVGISIYPVMSSSNFNEKMVEKLSGTDLHGLPIQSIDTSLFQKDLRTLQRDEDFISKNKEFYDREMFPNVQQKSLKGTISQQVDRMVDKYNHINQLGKYVDIANDALDYCVQLYNMQYKLAVKNGSDTQNIVKRMAMQYKVYCDAIDYIKTHLSYGDYRLRTSKDVYDVMKFAKPIATEKRSKVIWKLVEPYFDGVVSDVVKGKPYGYINMQPLSKEMFQIKNLVDPLRNGMKGYFNPTKDEELLKREVDKTKGTVFVIFDDNISGGATLSDICMQAKKLGIEHIIPITFGSMYYIKNRAGNNIVNGLGNRSSELPYKYN